MLLSAKCPRLLGRREDAIWKTIWRTIQRTNNIFWSNGWISSISPKDQVRIHRFDKKVLPGIFLGCVLITGGIWKGDILKADLEDLEKLDASEIYLRRINAKEVLVRQKRWWIHISNCRMVQQNRQEGTTNSENHTLREPTVRSEDLSGELQGESGESQPTGPTDDAEARVDFWPIQGDFIYRHHIEFRVQLWVPKEATIFCSTVIHRCYKVNSYWSGRAARETYWRLL